MFSSVQLPMLGELVKLFICAILHSSMPSRLLDKSIYMPTPQCNGFTGMLSLPLIEWDSKFQIQ